jgi:hypothetical protein
MFTKLSYMCTEIRQFVCISREFCFQIICKCKYISKRFKTEVTKRIYVKFRTGSLRRNLLGELILIPTGTV